MSLSPDRQRSGESRPSLESWLVLALSILLLATSVFQTAYRFSLPSDGWSYARDLSGTGRRLVLDRALMTEPSALEHGDVLVAIQGLPIEEILTEALSWQGTRPPPAAWEEGRALRYTVVREGQPLDIFVPLRVLNSAEIAGNVTRSLLLDPSLLPALLIAFYVFARRPGSRAAQLLLLVSVCFFVSNGISQVVTGSNVMGPAELFHREAYWGAVFFSSLIWPFLIAPFYAHLFLTFPVVKAPMRVFPRPTLALIYGLTPALTLGLGLLRRGDPLAFWDDWALVSTGIFFLTLTVVAASMIHTLLTAREPARRAQIRWVAVGALITSVGAILGGLATAAGLLTANSWVVFVFFRLPYLAFPLALGLAILRYRLFEIDILLRRTLTYSVFTGLLTAIYIGIVILLQQVLGALAVPRRSELITVLSTLTIAALFVPLRGQVQRVIDRRFYRRKYDFAQTLAGFGEVVRDEVDLDRLSAQLVQVVQETMQPESVSLWLMPLPPPETLAKDG